MGISRVRSVSGSTEVKLFGKVGSGSGFRLQYFGRLDPDPDKTCPRNVLPGRSRRLKLVYSVLHWFMAFALRWALMHGLAGKIQLFWAGERSCFGREKTAVFGRGKAAVFGREKTAVFGRETDVMVRAPRGWHTLLLTAS